MKTPHQLTLILIIATIITSLSACSSSATKSLSVTLDKTSVEISEVKTDVINYTAVYFNGEVVPSFTEGFNAVTLSNDFDKATGKGKITFSSTKNEEKTFETAIVFADATGSFTTGKITIRHFGLWSVIPEDPEYATE